MSSLAPGTAIAVADSGSDVRPRPSGRTSAPCWAGRTSPDLGCARDRCVEGAVPWRKVAGAEACALAGQPQGLRVRRHRRRPQLPGPAPPVDRGGQLLRLPARPLARWPSPTPRSARRPASVYVTLSETAGRYDECLTTARAAALSQRAAAHGTTLAAEVARAAVACRPRVRGPLMVGDSVSWRGSDELARLRPGPDGRRRAGPPPDRARRPASRPSAAQHGQPTGLVVELGTNPAPGLRAPRPGRRRAAPPGRDAGACWSLPYVEVSSDPVVVSSWSQRFDGWMRSLAAGRPHTCVADWPAYVRVPPRPAPGRHPPAQRRRGPSGPAWVLQQWSGC